jgi:hypothetical protein
MSDLPENDPRTPEQAEADWKFVLWFVEQLEALGRRERETCPYCGAHVDALREAGRDIYAVPCGCRVWQGVAVPPAWRQAQDDDVT